MNKLVIFYKNLLFILEAYANMNPDEDQEEELVSVKKKPGALTRKGDDYDDEDSHDKKRTYRK